MKNTKLPLRLRLSLAMLTLAFPVLIILVITNVITFRNRQKETLVTIQQMASRAVEQNNYMLNSITSTVGNFAVSSNTIDNMQYLDNEADRLFARLEMSNWIKTSVMSQYPDLEMFFAYSSYTGDYLTRFGSGGDIGRRESLRQEILQVLQSDPKSSTHWNYVERQGRMYLEYFFHYDQMYFGALLPADCLDEQISFVTSDGGVFCLWQNDQPVRGAETLATLQLTGAPDESRYARIDGKPYVLVPLQLENPDQEGLLVLSAEASLAGLTTSQILFLVFSALMIAAFWIMYRMLQANVTKPVDLLVDAMSRIGDRDLSYRVDTSTGAPEFAIIGTAFNQMMDKIEMLTAEIYSREIENQKVRLRNLQMQINPHFLSNCMNVIHSASVPQNWEIVRQMTGHLTSYFRFMNSLSADEVLLEEELRYTRDFLSIQELRFPDKFHWEIAVPDYLGHARIPPLVIKTFAENTLKHARQGDDYVELLIEAEMDTGETVSRLHLHITDNGPGFPSALLKRWAQGGTISPDGIHHIGLDNIRSRLQLTYGNAAELQLANLSEGGASVHLYIPLDL